MANSHAFCDVLPRFMAFCMRSFRDLADSTHVLARSATVCKVWSARMRIAWENYFGVFRRFPAFSGVFSGPPNVSGVLGKVRRPGKTAPAELFTPPSRGIFHRIAPRSMRGKRAYKYVFPLNLSLSRTWQLKYKHLVLCDFNLLDF